MSDFNIVKLQDHIVKTVGDGPVWLEDSNELVFVDYFKAKVYKLHGDTNELVHQVIPGRGCISLAYPTTQKDRFLALSWLDIVAFDWKDPDNRKIIANFDEGKNTQVNDGRGDRNGRLWFATFGVVPCDEFVVDKGLGSIYRAEIDGEECKITKAQAEPADLSNGFEWSTDNRTMFFVDTLRRVVNAFDYDATSGEISNQRVVIDFAKHSTPECNLGNPDGLTVDVNNNLWVAGYDGGNICCFDTTTGQLIDRIDGFDTKAVTACVFGGPYMNQLYVTSSPGTYEDGGSIFRVDGLQTKGLPTNRVNAPSI